MSRQVVHLGGESVEVDGEDGVDVLFAGDSSTASGSSCSVSGSMSAKTGSAPASRIAFALATNENGVVTTRSPWPRPSASRAAWSAVVPLVVATP